MSVIGSGLGIMLAIILLILAITQATFILVFALLALTIWILTKCFGLSLKAFKLN